MIAIDQLSAHRQVNALIQTLLTNVEITLRNRLSGVYLSGSLASGDFDQHSDIDFVVVTEDEITHDLFPALQAMHARVAASDSQWGIELEGSYFSQCAIRRYDPTNDHYPHLSRGNCELVVEEHGYDWVIQRHILRERGIVLAGPDPVTMIAPVSPDELRRAVEQILWKWWEPMLRDPSRLQNRGYQSYAVLTMCRMLYTLEQGLVVSKSVAARWAKVKFARWDPLIERAWIGRQNPRLEAQMEDVKATLDFIRYTLDSQTKEDGL